MKNLIAKNTLVLAVAGMMLGTAHASTEQEVQQLRSEVNALKALLEQNLQAQRVAPAAAPAKKSVSFGSKSGADVAFYGFVRGDAVYGLQGNTNSVFNDIASATNANDIKLNTTVATTRLGFDFKAPVEGHKVGGKVETDFVGNGYNGTALRIRHAYLTYDNWLIGQTWSTFNDLNLLADINDFNLMAGQAAARLPMVRYEKQANRNTTYAVALERTSSDEKAPTLVGRVQQKFAADKAYISARGFIGQSSQANVTTTTPDTYEIVKNSQGIDEVKVTKGATIATPVSDKELAWGVGIGGAYQLSEASKVMVDYNHVKGNKQYVTGANAAHTVVGDQIAQNEFDSVVVGTAYQVTPKTVVNAGVSYVQAKDDNAFAKANPNANEKLKQTFVNVNYNPVKPVTVGVEYVYGERETFKGDKGTDERVGFMAKYAF